MVNTKNKTALLDVAAGFFGAGKTEFISSYARFLQDQGIRFMIIKNEFGPEAMDAAYYQSQGFPVREIGGGCICCGLKIKLHDLLLELSADYQRIILEPPGTLKFNDLLQILGSSFLQGKVAPGMILGIVDPLSLNILNSIDRQVLVSQLAPVGRILLSKGELYGAETISAAQKELVSLLSAGITDLPADAAADWIETRSWSELTAQDYQQLMTKTLVQRDYQNQIESTYTSLFEKYAFRMKKPCSEEKLQKALEEMLSGKYGGIMRIKGFCPLEAEGSWLIEATAPADIRIRAVDFAAEYRLSVIGHDLPNPGQLISLL
jgi:G3E family GTPase